MTSQRNSLGGGDKLEKGDNSGGWQVRGGWQRAVSSRLGTELMMGGTNRGRSYQAWSTVCSNSKGSEEASDTLRDVPKFRHFFPGKFIRTTGLATNCEDLFFCSYHWKKKIVLEFGWKCAGLYNCKPSWTYTSAPVIREQCLWCKYFPSPSQKAKLICLVWWL